ncbi:hypothetical protein A1Q2_06574 [Trichosporon asahii var. asahii CBS 8904]|uniref:APS kinase domain-containing protein n=1 Tax=Trichosporon asahii var. asahii (strain CBS 8904) TaxID=1220162 RepID=K1VEA2_TRIAC|nr:hypothetical protein A1Q2_06574 [Trichosporon asahii var. asahii CBS 8904]
MSTDAHDTVARTIFLNGTVGSGKTTTATAIGSVLEERQIPHAVIDIDQLSTRWPSPADDPFDFRLTLANVISVAANYRAAGVQIVVLAGVIETMHQLRQYEEGLGVGGAIFDHVMLVAPPSVVKQRLLARHEDEDELQWHVKRAPELAMILDSAGLPGPTFDTNQPLKPLAQRIIQTVLDP